MLSDEEKDEMQHQIPTIQDLQANLHLMTSVMHSHVSTDHRPEVIRVLLQDSPQHEPFSGWHDGWIYARGRLMLGLAVDGTFTMIMVREVLHRVNSGDRDGVVPQCALPARSRQTLPRVDVVFLPGDLGKQCAHDSRDLVVSHVEREAERRWGRGGVVSTLVSAWAGGR